MMFHYSHFVLEKGEYDGTGASISGGKKIQTVKGIRWKIV